MDLKKIGGVSVWLILKNVDQRRDMETMTHKWQGRAFVKMYVAGTHIPEEWRVAWEG